MNPLSWFVVRHQKSIIASFLVMALICACLAAQVTVNYNMVDYLPDDAQSTTAIRIMENQFSAGMPNARVMTASATLLEGLDHKAKLSAIEGVTAVSWLDDAVGADTLKTTPAEFLDPALLQNYYRDERALFTVTIESGMEKSAVASIRALIGENNAVTGSAVDTASAQEMSASEVIKAISILLPVVLAILILSTVSWIEPLLFLISIGVAVIINMGTNMFFGEISFITQTVSPILQMAVSLDYAIFLLHSFNEFRLHFEPEKAMGLAVKKALSAVSASAATTVVGFLALLFMRFSIGSDLGINLVKGVVFSFISVMVFLPALTLACFPLIDRTKHRPFIPDFKGVGKVLTGMCIPFLVIAVIIAVPCFLAQANTEFIYGTGGMAETSRAGKDAANIEKLFGKENMLVLLVPRGEPGKETELCGDLSATPHVTGLLSYVTAVGAQIPPEYIPDAVTAQFYSPDYARIILYTDLAEESTETFAAVGAVLDTAARHYDEYFLAGQGATLYDMKNTVSADTKRVNLAAVIGIFLILLVTFLSLSLPLILLFTIETAIWINLSFAYFTGHSFNFIGYLVISTVQLGSTVDYAILMTDRYLHNRKELPRREALQKTIDENLIAVIISAAILALAGFILALTSSNAIISELGILLGRGTALSFTMVAFVLPALLILFDRAIQKTTKGSGFHVSGG